MTDLYANLTSRFGPSASGRILVVELECQRLHLYQHGQHLQSWPVSTAARGSGNQCDSLQTPLGVHRIADKIGAGCRPNTIFKARQDTGVCADIIHEPRSSDQDLITSRILWLQGMEDGINLHGDVDTYSRYIYIHGTPEEGMIGQPVSHGCIRMRNDDIIELFEQVEPGTLVYITENQAFA